jgi:hypothetical protein
MLSKRDQVAIKRCVGDAVEQVERLEYYQRAAGLLPTLETSKEVCNETQTSLQAQTTFCEKHGVLTSFLGTLRIDGCVTSFPIITGLNNVSSNERVRYNDNVFTPIEMVQQFNMFNGDPRVCHMGNKNNMKFALLLLRMANEKTKNTIVDCLRDYSWEQFDESNDKLFKEWLEYYK